MNAIRERLQRDQVTSMLYWYPKVKDHATVPKTVFVQTPTPKMGTYEGREFPKNFMEAMFAAGKLIGYPLFLRTDMVSAKFEWGRTCFVNAETDLEDSARALIEFAECATFIGLETQAFAFREFLELQSSFRAFDGMPVAKERRYFVRNGEVICHHPYWIEDAIAQWVRHTARLQAFVKNEESLKMLQAKLPPSDWREKLSVINTESPEEVTELTVLAEKASRDLPGFWSIDFAYGKRKNEDLCWFLIDAARGEDSSHIPSCPNCPEDQKKHPDGEEE